MRPAIASDDSRGSSVPTIASGCGLNSASWVTFVGLVMSIAWKPPECQVLNAMLGVSVGLWAEYDVRGGSKLVQESGWFSGSRKSLRTTGRVSSATSTMRVQPHGQPWPLPVIVP